MDELGIYIGEDFNGTSDMFCRDPHTLHIFAERMGVKRNWFKDQPGYPHYNIGRGHREIAIRFGATAVTPKQMIIIVKGKRNIQKLRVGG